MIHRSASLPTATAAAACTTNQGNSPNNDQNEFKFDNDDDEWNDNNLATIDHYVTMTQSHNIIKPASKSAAAALIHNRRHNNAILGAATRNEQQQPTFLSFTRYIVRNVQDHLDTYTKTIAVSLWKLSSEKMGNNGKNDEPERLKNICGR